MGQACSTTAHPLVIGCNSTETKSDDHSLSSIYCCQVPKKTSDIQKGDRQTADLNCGHLGDLVLAVTCNSSDLKKTGNQTDSLLTNASNSSGLRDDDHVTTSVLPPNHAKPTPTSRNHRDAETTSVFVNKNKPTPTPRSHGYADIMSLLPNHAKPAPTTRNQDKANLVTTFCGFVDQSYVYFYQVWITVDSMFFYWLPVLILVPANTATWIKVCRSSRESLTSSSTLALRRKRHVIILTSLISVGFIIFVTPLTVVLLIKEILADEQKYILDNDKGEILAVLQLISECLYLCNHSFNFFLYILSGKRFRNSLKAALCKYERGFPKIPTLSTS